MDGADGEERQLLTLSNQTIYKVDTSFESSLGTVMDFIGDPHNIWVNGDLEEKRLVLKLAFAKRIPYDKNKGFGTASMTLPFTVLGDMSDIKSKMVEENKNTWNQLAEVIKDWAIIFHQRQQSIYS